MNHPFKDLPDLYQTCESAMSMGENNEQPAADVAEEEAMTMTTENKGRLYAWKERWFQATGRKPTDIPHTVGHCRFCHKPVWRPLDYMIDRDHFMCSSPECEKKLLRLSVETRGGMAARFLV